MKWAYHLQMNETMRALTMLAHGMVMMQAENSGQGSCLEQGFKYCVDTVTYRDFSHSIDDTDILINIGLHIIDTIIVTNTTI